MLDAPIPKMTVDEFMVWAEGRTERYELVGGWPHAMSPERIKHTRAKGWAFLALHDAIQRACRPCEVLQDGATVRIDVTTAFEPDVLVRCGPPLDDDALEVPDAMIVVEVLSPSTGRYDRHDKLAGYFTVASVHHYLIVDIDRRVVIHYARNGEVIQTRILGTGPLHLDPPGLDLRVEDLLGEA